MNTLPPGSANALMTSESSRKNSHGSVGYSPSVTPASFAPIPVTYDCACSSGTSPPYSAINSGVACSPIATSSSRDSAL